MQEKGIKFKWITKFQEIFDKLKQLLTTTPILKIAYLNKEFTICTDACFKKHGSVLMQENAEIANESRKLKKYENNYVVYYLNLATMIHTLKMWRHYQLGNNLIL